MWQAYKDKGLKAVAINVWEKGGAAEKAKGFAQKHKLSFPVFVDSESITTKLLGVRGVPTNVVIGKDGKLAYVKAGYDESGMIRAIEAALQPK